MSDWLGDFPVGSTTVTCMFTTHAAAGGPIAPLSAFEAADVLVYKNGSATQRTSTNGITMTSPFDSIVGLHRLLIDTTDNTDAGFWSAGAVYTLVLSPDTETVDGVTVLKVIGQFGLSLAGVDAVKSDTDTIVSIVGGINGTVGVLEDPVFDGFTFNEVTLLMASILLGKSSGLATATGKFRALDDSKDRITSTVDADGNRSAQTLDPT